MNLTFLNLVPSQELYQTLLKHFSVSKFESAKELLDDRAEKNLIAYKIHSPKDIDAVAHLRKAYPSAWLVLVVKKTQLESSFYTKLLNAAEKNDVWLLEEWETTIWFSLERWFQYAKLQTANRKLKSNLKKLSQKTDTLVERFEYNLSVVEKIQRSILPKSRSSLSGINISAKYIPALGKGGDYYDLFEYNDNRRIGILLADASTHTMAAALLSVLFKLKAEDFASSFRSSRAFVTHVCEELELAKAKALAPMSFFYGILDRNALTFDFTTAGSISPLIWRDGKALELPHPKNPPIGICASFPYREVQVDLAPGDLVVMHTDGLNAPLEQKGKSAKEQVVSLLKNKGKIDPISLRNDFLGLVESYRSKRRLKDDLTFLNLSIDERAMYLAK